MKLCAVIILYNPEEIGINSIIENINTYSAYTQKLFIIDNSQNENEEIKKHFPDAFYFLNKNKGGIGGAQNIGLTEAMKNGFEWAMTMDQDTSFNQEQIARYIKNVKTYISTSPDIVSFSLRAENQTNTFHWTDIPKNLIRPFVRKLLGPKKLPSGISYPVRCISSANIIKTEVWEKVKGFNEDFFIDQVDYDFCYRIISAGWKILKFNDIFMNQHFGEAHNFSLFRKKYPKYSDFRFYHCIRNSFIIKKWYPQYKNFHKEYIRDLFLDYCVNSIHPFKNLKIFIKAYKDSLKF